MYVELNIFVGVNMYVEMNMYVEVNMFVGLLIILYGLLSSRSSWWTGGWAALGDASSCSVVSWIHTPYITCIRLSVNVTCKL